MRNTDTNAITRCITKSHRPDRARTATLILMCAALLAGASLSACSNANWYQTAKANRELECRKQPLPTYDDCLRSYDKSYLDYKKQREQAVKN